MDAIFVVVLEVLSNVPPQMGFAQHDHVVQKLSATAANPALRYAVEVGRPRWQFNYPGPARLGQSVA